MGRGAQLREDNSEPPGGAVGGIPRVRTGVKLHRMRTHLNPKGRDSSPQRLPSFWGNPQSNVPHGVMEVGFLSPFFGGDERTRSGGEPKNAGSLPPFNTGSDARTLTHTTRSAKGE